MARFKAAYRDMHTWLHTEPTPKPPTVAIYPFQSAPFLLNDVPVRLRVRISEQDMSAYAGRFGHAPSMINDTSFLQWLEKGGKLRMDIARADSANWEDPAHWLKPGERLAWNSVTTPPGLQERLLDVARRTR